jgi:hypothetical protein
MTSIKFEASSNMAVAGTRCLSGVSPPWEADCTTNAILRIVQLGTAAVYRLTFGKSFFRISIGAPAINTVVSRGIPHSLKADTVIVLRFGNDRFLSNPLQFIKHPQFYSMSSMYWLCFINHGDVWESGGIAPPFLIWVRDQLQTAAVLLPGKSQTIPND